VTSYVTNCRGCHQAVMNLTGLDCPACIAKSELLQCFRRGFKHGAGASAKDAKFTDHARSAIHEAYNRGYERGREASFLASADECTRLGYDARMSVLRGPLITEPPKECLHSWVKLDDVRMCRHCGAPYQEPTK